jgi:uncharacterized protein YwgA
MKLTEGFITHESEGEQIMVSAGETGFAGLVRSNATAGFIVDCLKEETTREEIVDKILERYDVARDVAEQDLEQILQKLQGIGAIHE